MYKQINRISMKHLWTTLQHEFGDFASCTISPYSHSIHIVPCLATDFFTQSDVLTITQYCQAHNLHFILDCKNGRFVVYYPGEIENLEGIQ